jgi:hypothetical protein
MLQCWSTDANVRPTFAELYDSIGQLIAHRNIIDDASNGYLQTIEVNELR